MRHILASLLFVSASLPAQAAEFDWAQPSVLNGITRSMTALKAAAPAAVPATAANAPASAQAAPAAPKAIIRTKTGLRYEIPRGWLWKNFDGNVITLYDPRSMENGQFQASFGVIPTNIFDIVDFERGWDTVDYDSGLMHPIGAIARCKFGKRYGLNLGYLGALTFGAKGLHVDLVSTSADIWRWVWVINDAVGSIIYSAREVPASNSLYHPTLGIAAEPLDSKFWFNDIGSRNLAYYCVNNGVNGDTRITAVPTKDFPDTGAALADLAGQLGVTVGATQSAAVPGGEILWIEPTGSKWLFAGAMRRDGRYFSIASFANTPNSCTRPPSREDFLAVARGLRAWDGN